MHCFQGRIDSWGISIAEACPLCADMGVQCRVGHHKNVVLSTNGMLAQQGSFIGTEATDDCSAITADTVLPGTVAKLEAGPNVDSSWTQKDITAWVTCYGQQSRKKFIFTKNSGRFLQYECTDANCNASISFRKRSRSWEVAAAQYEHVNCTKVAPMSGEELIRVVGPQVVSQSSLKELRFIGNELTTDVHLMSTLALYRAKVKARVSVELQGRLPFYDDFHYLHSYLKELKAANPGSVVTLETKEVTDVDGSAKEEFVRLFVMTGTQARVAAHCIPHGSIDGAFMKRYEWAKFQLLVFTALDGNGKDQIVAIAIVPSESKDNVAWLLDGMIAHPDVRSWLQSPNFVLTTDRGLGILAAIKEKLPHCIPRLCALHLLGSLPKVVDSLVERSRSLYWDLVKCKSKGGFDATMELLRRSQPAIAEYLRKIPPPLWADYAFPGSTLGRCTSSSAERAINSIGAEFRANGPVYALKAFMLNYCKRLLSATREAEGRKEQGDLLTTYAANRLDANLSRVASYKVEEMQKGVFWVCHHTSNATASGFLNSGSVQDGHVVNVCEHCCDCMQKGVLRLEPCIHELCVEQKMGRSVVDSNHAAMWFHPAFFTDDLVKALSNELNPCLNNWLDKEPIFISPAVDLLEDQPRKRTASGKLMPRIQSNFARHFGLRNRRTITLCGVCKASDHTRARCPWAKDSSSDVLMVMAKRITRERLSASKQPTPKPHHSCSAAALVWTSNDVARCTVEQAVHAFPTTCTNHEEVCTDANIEVSMLVSSMQLALFEVASFFMDKASNIIASVTNVFDGWDDAEVTQGTEEERDDGVDSIY